MKCLAAIFLVALSTQAAPLRVGVVGLVHGHVRGFFNRSLGRTDIQVVGIAEPDAALAAAYTGEYKLSPALVSPTVDEMLDRAKPEAVVVFTNTFDHRSVVAACAKRGVHVMMEKPLAVSNEHAEAITQAARAGKIHVLVNYETTWYRSNAAAWNIVKDQKAIGDIRKVVIHDGHKGPKEIGVPPEFFGWLTDPKLNGAGALFDFGCYGADLMTWLMDGKRPLSVTAVTQRLKPEIYQRVDDEATVILEYPRAQAIIQASWNWPFDRKDMEIYGQTGTVMTVRGDGLRVRVAGQQAEETRVAKPLEAPHDDPLSYLTAVVRGTAKADGLSGLPINMVVTEILDAARQSAATGKTVRLKRP
ncbi:MAG: Gfo/Idh/MocA family oxidoreductase [Bryobacteraceae bacterium]